MMRLAMRLPAKKAGDTIANDADPREGQSAEIIDLASRTAYPAVTQRKGKSDGFGMAAGVAVIGLIGAVTLWSMNAARTAPPEGVGNPNLAAVPQAPMVPPQAVTPLMQPVPQAPVGMVRADPAPQPVLSSMPSSSPVAAANPFANPTVVFDAGAKAPLADGAAAAPRRRARWSIPSPP
jgi:type IV secretion system protein VirB10